MFVKCLNKEVEDPGGRTPGGGPKKGVPPFGGLLKKSLQTFVSMSLLQNKFYKNIMLSKKL
uniref:Uncharacterized protein n=1 Tax=viral metagenome TaxID=1070528 RepID=A0A6C0B593_9ZZZZ